MAPLRLRCAGRHAGHHRKAFIGPLRGEVGCRLTVRYQCFTLGSSKSTRCAATWHGKPAHWAPQQWSPHEHLVAGAFAYPLVLKCLLAQNNLYALNEEDVAWTLGLEGLLTDRPFFEVSPKPQVVEVLPGKDGALSVPDSARTYQTRWQLRFDDINNALFGMALSRTINEVLDKE